MEPIYRYSKFNQFNKFHIFHKNDPTLSKVFLCKSYENWEGDSTLIIYENFLEIYPPVKSVKKETFNELDDTNRYFYNPTKLNFIPGVDKKGYFNLKKIIYLDNNINDSIPISILEYNSYKDQYDMDRCIYYSPDYGIIALYSINWDNLALLDSLYNSDIILDSIPQKLVSDSLIFSF